MYSRLCKPLESNSFFLFGARGTGKSTLLRSMFTEENSYWFDLLDFELESRLLLEPKYFAQVIDSLRNKKNIEWIVVDEVQKVPGLLNYVHQEIEKKRFKFALTGSSARKLRRGAANLLAGRAFQNSIYPLTFIELGSDFHFDEFLQWGGLPAIYGFVVEERKQYLRTYVQTYLKEEIQAEQLVRKLPPFREFLNILGDLSGTIVNYSKIARDINSDPVTVKNYFEIIEDTLLGFRLPSYHTSIRKRQTERPKFYLYDLGVRRALMGRLNSQIEPKSRSYGVLFEHFLVNEILRKNEYERKDWKLTYLKTKDQVEIDLIVDRPGEKTLAIEIKSTESLKEEQLKAFSKLATDIPDCQMICLSQDPIEREILGVTCMPWQNFFTVF